MALFRRMISTLSVAMVCTFGMLENSLAETRVALVIGNGAYQEEGLQLPNPPHDAADVAAALRRVGFATILATNLDKRGMEEAEIRFARAARTADVAMFYYSGHAMQFAGVNYLAPIDIQLHDEADLHRMVRLNDIVSDLQQAKNLRILVLDACRDNPLAVQLERSIGATRSLPLQRGLAKIDAPQGMIVSYATQAGQTAEDGNGRNSPYTAAFLRNIDAKEEIGTIFRRISADVYEATDHKQLPELSLSLIGEFYLRGKAELSITSKPSDAAKDEFEAAESLDTVGAWDAFLAKHPTGFYAALAKERRAGAASSMAALTPSNIVAPPRPSTGELSMRECAARYKAAEAAGTLNGQKWNAFRKTQCGTNAIGSRIALPSIPHSSLARVKKPASVTRFPRAIESKYASEAPGMARMHTCVDQYRANKATNSNGGLRWIQKGGGYYSQCNKRLKGA